MSKQSHEHHGASPLPKGKHKPLFKKPKIEEEQKPRDITGQTDTALHHMKQRLRETPKRSAGSEHDKHAYDEENE